MNDNDSNLVEETPPALWVLIVPLLLYSSFRNGDLILTTLGQDTISLVAAFLVLFALDIGVVLWTRMLGPARGWQEGLCFAMIGIDMVGALMGMIADHQFRGGAVETAALVRLMAWWGVPIVIGINLGAGFMYPMLNPARRTRERRRKEQEALDETLNRAKHTRDLARMQSEAARYQAEAEQYGNQAHATRSGGGGQRINPAEPLGAHPDGQSEPDPTLPASRK